MVEGEEGRQLGLAQARAIRDLLTWVHGHRGANPSSGSDHLAGADEGAN